jgi:hypothetical protein
MCHREALIGKDSTALRPSRLLNYSRFLRAPFQFSKRAAGEAAEFSRSGIELLGVIGAARLECGEPAAEARELIWRQVGNSFGDFFDFHGAQYSKLPDTAPFELSEHYATSHIRFTRIAAGMHQVGWHTVP